LVNKIDVDLLLVTLIETIRAMYVSMFDTIG